MAEAIVIRDYGTSEVLQLENVNIAPPSDGEIRIRQTAIGVNFHDVYVRSGLYKTLELPGIPGCEAVGVVEEIGSGVSDFMPGDRVAYVTSSYGGYASERILPAELALKIPDNLDDPFVASMLLRSLTVDMLINQVHKIEDGMTILVHAAAGGVGRLLTQWASHIGAIVIGTVGSSEKSDIAYKAGCAHTILYRDVDFRTEIDHITSGKGVDIVYDSVGCDTFSSSLDVLSMCGHIVSFGQSSGPVEPVVLSKLAEKSLTITRPILFHYIDDEKRLSRMIESVYSVFSDGVLTAENKQLLPLAEVAQAHNRLESREAKGPMILIP